MSTQSTTPPKTRISAEMFTQLQKNMTETRRAFDAFSNPIARLGVGTDSLLEGTQYPLTRLSFNYILLQSLYRSNWIARKVVDAVAEDMTKNWVRVDTEMNPNQIQAFDQTIKKTATRAQLLTTMKWGRLFGGAAAIMVIEGHEEQLEEELDFDDVELGSFKGLIPLDRWSGISPSGALCSDINRPFDFGLPEFYTVQPNNGSSFKIHCSRVLRFIGHDLPVWEKQVEQYWGISVIEPMFEELKKFDNTSWNIANLVFRANIIALRQKGLDQMLSGLGTSAQAQKNFYASLEAQSRLLSSQGLLILPEDGGIEEHSYSFGGMKEVYESFKENICGSVDIPYSRLFGRPPGGLSTTNEGDEFAYYENVGAKQNREVDPQLQKLMPVVAMSTWGKIPKDFNWKFNPVRALTNETRSTLGKDKTTSVVEVYNTGLVSDKTALMELKAQTEETGLWSNITDEDIEKADDEPKGVMMMGEGLGMEGKEASQAMDEDYSAKSEEILRKRAIKELRIEGAPNSQDLAEIKRLVSHYKREYNMRTGKPVKDEALDAALTENEADKKAHEDTLRAWGTTSITKIVNARQRQAFYKEVETRKKKLLNEDEAVRKYTQVEAQYEFPAKGRDVCLNCEYFKDGEKPECSQTLGPIQAKGWCKFFEAKVKTVQGQDGFLGDLVEKAKAGFHMGKKLAGADENVDIERRIELSNGLVIYIENEEGSIRKGPWGEVVMRNPYGYIAGTAGTDGDCVDIFLGPGYETIDDVYVVHQGGDDPEDKLMIGFASARAAMQGYLANYAKPPAPDDWSMERVSLYQLPQKLAKFNGRRIVRHEYIGEPQPKVATDANRSGNWRGRPGQTANKQPPRMTPEDEREKQKYQEEANRTGKVVRPTSGSFEGWEFKPDVKK